MDLITATRNEGLEFRIRVRGHEVTSDMSVADGGADRGPSPAELFGSALGVCIGMMVQSYCDAHGFAGDVGVNFTVELADAPKRVAGVVVDVELPEGFPAERMKAVRRVAERCLIHETLTNPPTVDIDFM